MTEQLERGSIHDSMYYEIGSIVEGLLLRSSGLGLKLSRRVGWAV
jgi:hypothetical protein